MEHNQCHNRSPLTTTFANSTHDKIYRRTVLRLTSTFWHILKWYTEANRGRNRIEHYYHCYYSSTSASVCTKCVPRERKKTRIRLFAANRLRFISSHCVYRTLWMKPPMKIWKKKKMKFIKRKIVFSSSNVKWSVVVEQLSILQHAFIKQINSRMFFSSLP